MRMRWFGEPWPSDELRAPVCEDDDLHVPAPVGIFCQHCMKKIASDDQGVVMEWTGPVMDDCTFSIVVSDPLDASTYLVVATHLECFLRSILGPAAKLR